MSGPEYFMDPTILMYEKLLLAMVLGAIIGTERAIVARQTAGTRTFGLVAMGACLFILAGNFVDSHYLGVVNFNPSQVAAAVVSGIGFLGAGLIIFHKETLHGVTTAAGLWMVAGIGVAVGFGMYEVAVFSTLLSLILFTGMWYVEAKVKNFWTAEPSPTTDSL